MSSYSSINSLSQVVRTYQENTRPKRHVENINKEVPAMFGTEKKGNNQETEKITYDVIVEAARPTRNDSIVMVDLKVNGVSIKSCMLKEITVQKDGEKHKKGDTCYVLNFPSEKSGDKYYNRVWFPVSNEIMDSIVNQVSSML